jgi:FtsZ-binding cell division protein ZapB
LLDIVENAVKDRRVISFDKEKRDYLSVNTKATSLGIITEKSLEDNLAHFRKEIKAFKEKNKINYSTRDPAQQKIQKALEQENAQLKEDVSRLAELLKLQHTVTGGTKFTKTSVEAAARMLKKHANVKRMANTSELAQLLPKKKTQKPLRFLGF